MLIRSIASFVLAFTTITAANAAVQISYDSMPTVLKPGVTSYTLTAHSDGAPIIGFDFTGDPAAPIDPFTSPGFFGCLCQLNPAGNQTVFNDANGFIPFILEWDISQDTQFRFNSTSLNIVPNSARESDTMLQAAFTALQPLGTSVAFVQLAVPDGQRVLFRGTVELADGSTFPLQGGSLFDGGFLCVPEPSTFALAALALLGLFAFTRRRT